MKIIDMIVWGLIWFIFIYIVSVIIRVAYVKIKKEGINKDGNRE